MIRVLVVDDQVLVRAGLRAILEEEADIEVVGEAGDGQEAIAMATTATPDVILMDIRMPNMDGLEATRRICSADAPPHIVILTTFDLDEYAFAGLRAGASGFLLKDALPEELVHAVRVIAAGEAILAPAVTRRLLDRYARRLPSIEPANEQTVRTLTTRELEVLRLVAQGMSNGEIGAELHLAESSIKTHVSHLLAKLGLAQRVQLVVLAYETGLVQPNTI